MDLCSVTVGDTSSLRSSRSPVAEAMQADDEPPPGWRRPSYWEPQGGFIREDGNQPAPSTPLDFFSCTTPRPRPEASAEYSDWSFFQEFEEWFCGPNRQGLPPEEDEDEPTLPSGTLEKFSVTVAYVRAWKPRVPPSNEEKLYLYALYKQATAGRAYGEEPSMFDAVARAKFDAWKALGGMARGRAQLAYIQEATRQMEMERGNAA